MAHSLHNLASVVRHQGDHEQAARFQREGLAAYQQVGDKSGIATCLERMAMLACARAEAESAVRLFAIAESLRESVGEPPSPAERAASECALAAVETTLGEAPFAAIWAAARALAYEDGLAYAIQAGGHTSEPRPLPANTLA
jgi:non-specific serine/threonine protein kinase